MGHIYNYLDNYVDGLKALKVPLDYMAQQVEYTALDLMLLKRLRDLEAVKRKKGIRS